MRTVATLTLPSLLATALLATTLLAQTQPHQPHQQPPPTPSLTLPAFTAYAAPDPDAVRRDTKTGAVRRCAGELRFYVLFATVGELTITPEFAPTAAPTPLTVTIAKQPDGEPTLVSSTTKITTPGYHRITLAPDSPDTPITDLAALRLTGPATLHAHASTVERRNAASVHLAYEVPQQPDHPDHPDRDDIEWFYVELTPRTDPLHTYYEATGFRRGYFGMQVNSPTERRIIFSIWDAGDEPTHRSKVAAEDLVQLVAKGPGVEASGFGHEGTGGHSHLVHDWRLGGTFRFLVHAEVDPATPTHTTYTGWFWFADQQRWGLIASFRAPKDGHHLRGLYSFNENFGGSTGDQLRECEFGNAWVRTTAGAWLPLLRARFTHDGHGKEQRLDRSAGVRGDRFYLQNGGFRAPLPGAVTHYRDLLELPAAAGEPPATLPEPVRR